MIYWQLIPYDMSANIQNASINIYSNYYSFPQTTDVWGYGNYGGLAYVYDGSILMDSQGILDTDEYMTILVKLPKGTFNAQNRLNKNFEYYYNMAEKGTTKYEKNSNFLSVIKDLAPGIATILVLISSKLIYAFAKEPSNNKIGIDKDWKNKNRMEYFRDIPCGGDIFKAYYIAYQYNIVKKKTDILGAIILKWLKEHIVSIEKRETGILFKKNQDCIILQKDKIFENTLEQELYDIIYQASGDGVLESKEFEKWCNRRYTKVLNWFDKILKTQKDQLVNEGLLNAENNREVFHRYQCYATEELETEAVKIAGLKKYLEDYTLIEHREAIEVELFEEYLIYAQMMGIAKTVAKEFKELYPELMEKCNYNYNDIIMINYWSTMGINSANSAKASAQSYNSGGGGFSSGGGRRWFFWRRPEAGGGFR